MGPTPAPLEALAAKLRRPQRALAALACLGDDELRALERSIDQACERQRREVHQALRKSFPQPLRWLILGRRHGVGG
jgi:hypothetical protein